MTSLLPFLTPSELATSLDALSLDELRVLERGQAGLEQKRRERGIYDEGSEERLRLVREVIARREGRGA